MNGFDSRDHHSSPNHHEILVDGNWIKKRNENHPNRNSIIPKIKDMREINVYQPDFSLTFSHHYPEFFDVREEIYPNYTFFNSQNYRINIFNTFKSPVDSFISHPHPSVIGLNIDNKIEELIKNRLLDAHYGKFYLL